MKYKVIDNKTQTGTNRAYVLVHFWLDNQDPATDAPHQIEEFIMDMWKTRQQVVTNANGDWQKANGTFITTADLFAMDIDGRAALRFQFETINFDVRTRVRRNIERHIVSETKRGIRQGDFRDRGGVITFGDTDPLNIRADLDQEKGVERQRR